MSRHAQDYAGNGTAFTRVEASDEGGIVTQRRTVMHEARALTLQCERVRCGKPTCRSCPHGPYWYVYWTDASGRDRSAYIGRQLGGTAEIVAVVDKAQKRRAAALKPQPKKKKGRARAKR